MEVNKISLQKLILNFLKSEYFIKQFQDYRILNRTILSLYFLFKILDLRKFTLNMNSIRKKNECYRID